MMEEEEIPKKTGPGQVFLGMGLLLLLHLIWVVYPLAYVAIGLAQLVYVVPLVAVFLSKGRTGMMQGVLIGAGITFLLNAGCFGLLMGASL